MNKGTFVTFGLLSPLVSTLLLPLGCSSASSGSGTSCGPGTKIVGNECVAVAGDGDSGGSTEAAAGPSFAGTWSCNFGLLQDGASSAIYSATPVTTVVQGNKLSVLAEGASTEPQSWFCGGFDYVIEGLNASLGTGTPQCSSYDTVTIQSAKFSISSDGTQLNLDEKGAEFSAGSTYQSELLGMCVRN
jgi:hypothetical protein